jgi:hypothetical protein
MTTPRGRNLFTQAAGRGELAEQFSAPCKHQDLARSTGIVLDEVCYIEHAILQYGAAGREGCVGVALRYPRAGERSVFKLVLQNLAIGAPEVLIDDDEFGPRDQEPDGPVETAAARWNERTGCAVKRCARVRVETLDRIVILVTDIQHIRTETGIVHRLRCGQRLKAQSGCDGHTGNSALSPETAWLAVVLHRFPPL